MDLKGVKCVMLCAEDSGVRDERTEESGVRAESNRKRTDLVSLNARFQLAVKLRMNLMGARSFWMSSQ